MQKRSLGRLGLLALAVVLGAAVWLWAVARREYNDDLVARLGDCHTLQAAERVLGWGRRDPAVVDADFAAYYWHLSSRDSHVEWAVQIVVNQRNEIVLINYLPRPREDSLLEKVRRWWVRRLGF
jgi:hypothetical protein